MNLDISACNAEGCGIKKQCKRYLAYAHAKKIKWEYPLSYIASEYCLEYDMFHFEEKDK